MFKHSYALLVACLALATAHAQDCANYLFLQKDKTIEMTIYDKKGQPNGRQVYQVKDVSASGGTTTATISSQQYDKGGVMRSQANNSIQCTGGQLQFDLKLMLPPQQNEQYNTNVQSSGQSSYLGYPADMKVGDQLPDGTLNMDISHSGPGGGPAAPPPPGPRQTLTMVISNRKVEGQESITTTAGTWNCFKISYKSKITVKTGPFGFPVTVEGTEWFAPGFGVIKTQSKYGGTAITSIK